MLDPGPKQGPPCLQMFLRVSHVFHVLVEKPSWISREQMWCYFCLFSTSLGAPALSSLTECHICRPSDWQPRTWVCGSPHPTSTSGHSQAPQSPTSLTNIRFLVSTAYKISINADVCLNPNSDWDGMGWIDRSCNPVAETQNFLPFLYSNRILHFHSTK